MRVCSCCHNINCCAAVVAPIPFIALPHATCHLPLLLVQYSFSILLFVVGLFTRSFVLVLFAHFDTSISVCHFSSVFLLFLLLFLYFIFLYLFLFLHFSLIFRCFSFVVWCNLCYVFVVVVFLSVLFRFYLTARIDFPPVVVVIIAIRLFVFGSCL